MRLTLPSVFAKKWKKAGIHHNQTKDYNIFPCFKNFGKGK